MISGSVNVGYELVVPLEVLSPTGQPQLTEAILDTGYDGPLTLPRAVIAVLGLPWRSRSQATLADGSVQQFDVYSGTVNWDGSLIAIWVPAIDPTPLLGMALLVGYDLRARIRVGGSVEIEAIP